MSQNPFSRSEKTGSAVKTAAEAPARACAPENSGRAGAAEGSTKVIVIGNEKGGSGKTTAAMHLIVALMKSGFKTGAMDLDLRQKSLTRYLYNRQQWAAEQNIPIEKLPYPVFVPVEASDDDSRALSKEIETAHFTEAMQRFSRCDYLVIDCPGANTHLSRLAHAHADIIVTPMNDSFVDFDLLAKLDPVSQEIVGPSLYAEMVWEARQRRAHSGILGGIDWVVLRNRIGAANAKNKKRVGERLQDLSERIGFRLAHGFGERVIYRELFPMGLTLLDLGRGGVPRKLSSMNHITARQEIRALLLALKLDQSKPAVSKKQSAA